ncbi:ATP-binding protein [Stenotrophomonas sp. JC08]|uniref:ATP-binding protein n=1 Tax=Stenotrophomonas sp. JC08 TaxID=3445779 RepID=UPI003FA303C1
MNSLPAQLVQRLRQRGDSEHAQALVRIAIIMMILGYVSLPSVRSGLVDSEYRIVLSIVVGGLGLSLLLFGWLLVWPARSDPRRVAGMLADYGLMAAAMIHVGEPLAWVYIVVMWVTVGNGLRYGNNYLYVAVLMALTSFGATVALTGYWQQNLRLGLGLLLGLAAVPLYFSSLLRQLTGAMAEARRASDTKSRFLANMSHEFRTPLNGLSGMTELLATTRLDKEQRECLGTIQASAHSLLALVEEVLDISAIEAGKLRVEARDFSLAQLVESIGLILRPQARNKRLDYRVFIESGVPDRLHGDDGRLRQILLNLAGNAVKFTEQGSVEIRVSLGAAAGADVSWIRFEIVDTGVGVPEALQPRLFDAFEQADGSLARRYGGSGLGTAIAKGFTQALGGSIGYRENPAGGSCFWVELPFSAAQPPVTEVARTGAPGETRGTGAESGNIIAFTDPFRRHRARVRSLQVLVADDHEANRMVLQRLLQKAGHRVTCVQGAEEALDAMAAGEYEAVIADLHMPGLSGLDMLRQLRVMQAGGGPRTPVLILSADVTPAAIRRCTEAGAYAFMAKPVTAEKLLEAMAGIATGTVPSPAPAAAQHAKKTDDSVVLDTTVLDELSTLGMGAGFEQEFIRQCVADLETGIDGLSHAAQEMLWDRLREHAHAIKGVALNLGLLKVARQGGELMQMSDWQLKGEWRALHAGIGAALQEGRQALATRGSGRTQPQDDARG